MRCKASRRVVVLDQGRWVEGAMQQMKNWGWGMIEMTIGIMAGKGNGVKHFWHRRSFGRTCVLSAWVVLCRLPRRDS